MLISSFVINVSYAQTCTFNGNGDGVSWDDDDNWSCGSEPGKTDVIVIPSGFSVEHNKDLNYEGTSITINGSLDLGAKKLKLKGTSSALTISSTGSFTAKKLELELFSTATIASGASVTLEELKTKNFASINIDAACINVTSKIENKDAASITSTSGDGCIDFTGNNYTNSSSGGIFGCTSNTQSDCLPTGGGSGGGSGIKVFNGTNGTSWSDDDNWTPTGIPDTKTDSVTIPLGFSVDYDAPGHLDFKNYTVFTLCGTIALGNAHLHMKDNSSIELCPTAVLTGHEIKLEDNATGYIPDGANVNVEEIEVKKDGYFTIEACITVTEELKNKDDGTIAGGGCIDYQGPDNGYTNTGTGGIFTCVAENYGDCDLGLVTLPVEMSTIDAEIIDEEIVVNWETLSEINNSHFEIWLGSDIGGFKLVETIEGNGNSFMKNNYSVAFTPGITGVLYVKIRQVDYDGTYEDSKVLSLIYTPEFSIETVKLYPNPARNVIAFKNLKADEIYNLSVFSIEGEHLNSRSVSSLDNQLNINDFKPGYYIVRISDNASNQRAIRFLKTL